MAGNKKIIMEISKYDISGIEIFIEYFLQFEYPFYIDNNYCVYVRYDKKFQWIGYAKPFDEESFLSLFQ